MQHFQILVTYHQPLKFYKNKLSLCGCFFPTRLGPMYLNVLPMTVDHKNQSVVDKSYFKIEHLVFLGTSSSLVRFRKLLSGFKKWSPAMLLSFHIMSLKTWGTVLSVTASDSAGKNLNALYIPNSVLKVY